MAATVRFVVPDADDGLRLDQALARHVPGLSRRRARVGVFTVDNCLPRTPGRIQWSAFPGYFSTYAR